MYNIATIFTVKYRNQGEKPNDKDNLEKEAETAAISLLILLVIWVAI